MSGVADAAVVALAVVKNAASAGLRMRARAGDAGAGQLLRQALRLPGADAAQLDAAAADCRLCRCLLMAVRAGQARMQFAHLQHFFESAGAVGAMNVVERHSWLSLACPGCDSRAMCSSAPVGLVVQHALGRDVLVEDLGRYGHRAGAVGNVDDAADAPF